MKFFDIVIQNHLLNGGKITHSDLRYPIFFGNYGLNDDDFVLVWKSNRGDVFEFRVHQSDLKRNDWKIIPQE